MAEPEPVQLIKGKVLKTTEAWKPLDHALSYALGRHTESVTAGKAYNAMLDMKSQEYHHMLKVVVRALAQSKIYLTYVDSVDDAR